MQGSKVSRPAQAFGKGYFDQTAQLWNEAGEMVVTTHPVAYYRA